MKLVTKVTTIVAALAALTVFASCGSSSEAAKAAPAAKAPAAKASVWSWDKIPLSDIGTSDTVIDERIEIKPVQNDLGAKFEAVAGKAKFKTEDEGTALYHGNKASYSLAGIKDEFVAAYELTLAAPAKVTVKVAGNGDPAPSRCVAIFDAAGNVVASVDNIGKDPKVDLVFDAAAGVYTIKGCGHRIYAVNVQ